MLALALLPIAIALVCLAAAVELALFAVPSSRVSQLVAMGARGSQDLAQLHAHPASLLATVWTVRVIGTVLAAVAAWQFAGTVAPVARLGAVVVAILLAALAEVAGKTLAHRSSERFDLAAARATRLLSRLLIVVVWPAEQIVRRIAPEVTEIMPGISDREIRDLLGPGNGVEVIEEHERLLIQRAFLLDKTTAYDIMTPRVDMFAWSDTRTLADIAPDLRSVTYSRVPLYSETIDKITGVLHLRDAYQALISGQRDVQLRELAREPFFVPGSITLDRLLLDFQARRIHIGIVIDEYGAVDGLVALEDILEELVGEIIDESDIAEETIIRLSRHEILVNGITDLRDINHFFNANLPQLEHRSLNGYLLEVFGYVPQPGEKIDREGITIEVTAASDTQVLRARLSRQTPRSETGKSGTGLGSVPNLEAPGD